MRRFINDTEVREGAEITDLVLSQPVLGRRLKTGAVCEGLRPETWRGIITADGQEVWTSTATFASYEEANSAAREHVNQSLDRAVRSYNQNLWIDHLPEGAAYLPR
jgi:hypothetical protein